MGMSVRTLELIVKRLTDKLGFAVRSPNMPQWLEHRYAVELGEAVFELQRAKGNEVKLLSDSDLAAAVRRLAPKSMPVPEPEPFTPINRIKDW